jgi:hypothetical protein
MSLETGMINKATIRPMMARPKATTSGCPDYQTIYGYCLFPFGNPMGITA